MTAEKIQKVSRYLCTDGTEFEKAIDAQMHQRQLDVAEKFEPIYGSFEGCRIDYGDFKEWAEENRQFLIDFVKTL